MNEKCNFDAISDELLGGDLIEIEEPRFLGSTLDLYPDKIVVTTCLDYLHNIRLALRPAQHISRQLMTRQTRLIASVSTCQFLLVCLLCFCCQRCVFPCCSDRIYHTQWQERCRSTSCSWQWLSSSASKTYRLVCFHYDFIIFFFFSKNSFNFLNNKRPPCS